MLLHDSHRLQDLLNLHAIDRPYSRGIVVEAKPDHDQFISATFNMHMGGWMLARWAIDPNGETILSHDGRHRS
jgi:hypothetical protein